MRHPSRPDPSADKIAAGLLLGLTWARAHLAEFGLGEATVTFAKSDVARLKPLSELGLTMAVLRRAGVDLPVLGEIASFIWEQTGQGRVVRDLLLARNDFLPACALYAPLRELGYRSATLHATLRMLASSVMARALPLQPWARLALDYNLWKLGLLAKSRIRRSGLYVTARPEPWVMSGEIGYAITHEVMYLTDFGARRLDAPVEAYVQIWLPYWAERFAIEEDWDVYGELVIAGLCAGRPMSTELVALLAVQDMDGSVRGPDGAGSFLFTESDSASRRGFLGRYHTTLVAVMAFALSLHGVVPTFGVGDAALSRH